MMQMMLQISIFLHPLLRATALMQARTQRNSSLQVLSSSSISHQTATHRKYRLRDLARLFLSRTAQQQSRALLEIQQPDTLQTAEQLISTEHPAFALQTSGMSAGAYMCEYLTGACDRKTLADKIDAYWANQEKREY